MSRKTWITYLIIAVAVPVIVFLLFAGPGIMFSLMMRGHVVYKEYERVESPDGKVDAVLIIRGEGATGTDIYLIYVVPSGVKVRKKDVLKKKYEFVFYAKYLRGDEIVWLNNRLLEIRYENAESLAFRSSIQPFKGKGQPDHDYKVVVQLKEKEKTIKDPVDN